MKEQGPVFVTAFSPLAMIITAALAAIILAEQVRLGRYIFTNHVKDQLHLCLLIFGATICMMFLRCIFLLFFSVIGTILIVIGLYAVVWGKSKERSTSLLKDVKSMGHELPITNGTTKSSPDSKNDTTGPAENVVKVPINPQES